MTGLDGLAWDDVRLFLSMLRAPSLRQVADDLGISHPTASRRLSALEAQLGLVLFHRGPRGLEPTHEALQLGVAAEEVERAMSGLKRVALAADPALRGPLCVTLPVVLKAELLMPDLVAFCRRWPDIELQVDGATSLPDRANQPRRPEVRSPTCRFAGC